MLNFDYDLANKLKHIVEEEQRKITKARHDKDEHWKPKEFFETDRKINDKANAYQFVNQKYVSCYYYFTLIVWIHPRKKALLTSIWIKLCEFTPVPLASINMSLL